MFSPIGRRKVIAHLLLFIVNLAVLVLATKVNQFTDFFYVADLFPLGLSITTLVLLFATLCTDFSLDNSWVGYPQTETCILGTLSILWLSFSIFSTGRWNVPSDCNEAPDPFNGWCKNVHALKAFTWATFALCLMITVWTIAYSIQQYRRGHRHIFKTPLSRYEPMITTTGDTQSWFGRGAVVTEYPFSGFGTPNVGPTPNEAHFHEKPGTPAGLLGHTVSTPYVDSQQRSQQQRTAAELWY